MAIAARPCKTSMARRSYKCHVAIAARPCKTSMTDAARKRLLLILEQAPLRVDTIGRVDTIINRLEKGRQRLDGQAAPALSSSLCVLPDGGGNSSQRLEERGAGQCRSHHQAVYWTSRAGASTTTTTTTTTTDAACDKSSRAQPSQLLCAFVEVADCSECALVLDGHSSGLYGECGL